MEQRIADLEAMLSGRVTVGVDIEVSRDSIQGELARRGEMYCRLFDTVCARDYYKKRGLVPSDGCSLGSCFVSVRDILLREGQNLKTEIRLFGDEGAQIIYKWDDHVSDGWLEPPTVAVRKISGVWKIDMLFPENY